MQAVILFFVITETPRVLCGAVRRIVRWCEEGLSNAGARRWSEGIGL